MRSLFPNHLFVSNIKIDLFIHFCT